MRSFDSLIDETLHAEDIEELEAAADLFHYGIEKGYYTKRQADEFNEVYWRVKNKYLAYEIAERIKGNTLDLISIVKSAPIELKGDKNELFKYVDGRMKALRGKVGGLK